MKILVFVKQVPDTDDVKLDPKTGNLKREGVQSMINPLDANAIEAAVQLKEKYGGTVAAISMGPPQAEDMLKKAPRKFSLSYWTEFLQMSLIR